MWQMGWRHVFTEKREKQILVCRMPERDAQRLQEELPHSPERVAGSRLCGAGELPLRGKKSVRHQDRSSALIWILD